ncbi:hypothetical protein LZF95_16650 [Algoriphagus sp. AGSA1]|uniref:hypothetical protein n=1 Tax=Algoriphagus sp. AGSA1 TaxID=2907213 RepID=UPI001F45294B|nr:hypothetical protein [Algoriphagus sp. AGSA1]MCE7056314.1 hypothetical protein [Algoriphagus sp. AGSA1]
MNYQKGLSFGIFLLLIAGFFSCAEKSTGTIETTPYFDLKGFIEKKVQEVDSLEVLKRSEIQGEENQVRLIYSIQDWTEEFSIFKDADINKASMLQSYGTTKSDDLLAHELLPKAKGKLKYLKISYYNGEVSGVSIKIAEDNLFYSATTLAEINLNAVTHLIESYSIQTSQKIWFLEQNNMRIEGTVVVKG